MYLKMSLELSRVKPRSRNWLAFFPPMKRYHIWIAGFNLWDIICRVNWYRDDGYGA